MRRRQVVITQGRPTDEWGNYYRTLHIIHRNPCFSLCLYIYRGHDDSSDVIEAVDKFYGDHVMI